MGADGHTEASAGRLRRVPGSRNHPTKPPEQSERATVSPEWPRPATGPDVKISTVFGGFSTDQLKKLLYGELILFCSGIGMKRLLALRRLDIFTDDWTKRSGSRLVRL